MTRRVWLPISVSSVPGRIRTSFVRNVVVLFDGVCDPSPSSPIGQASELHFGQHASPAIERLSLNSLPQTSQRCGVPSGVREDGSFIGKSELQPGKESMKSVV